jgi:hypothetical protein
MSVISHETNYNIPVKGEKNGSEPADSEDEAPE